MIVRFAQEKDIPGMLNLLDQVGEVHHKIRPDLFRAGARKYDAAALEALLRDPTRPIFIGEENGQVAGYAFCIHKQTKDDPTQLDQKELYIDDLCVDESVRGKGVAKEIYAKVVAYAREQGFDTITLNVWAGNGRAQAFYEKCGLTPRKTMLEYRL